MRALFAGLTTRGKSFLAAGLAAGAFGLGLGERALLSIGIVLVALPLLAALATSRARYRIRCTRRISPPRVSAGQTAAVSLRLENISRLPTGLLLAEDTLPYSLGTRPRFVLERIEQGGWRELTYPIQSGARGKYTIGPLQVRVADAFGLVELTRSFAARNTLVVTPAIISLPTLSLAGNWRGEGGGHTRTADTAGEDDVIPRPYRDGDELRRVHWRSTARHGELMVRREEQRWRNRAVLLLDTRARAHSGAGAGSSFEYAASAIASIGVHLARSGIDGQLVTDTGPATESWPVTSWSSPASARSSVDLPEPLRPISATNSPGAMSTSSPSSTVRSPNLRLSPRTDAAAPGSTETVSKAVTVTPRSRGATPVPSFPACAPRR